MSASADDRGREGTAPLSVRCSAELVKDYLSVIVESLTLLLFDFLVTLKNACSKKAKKIATTTPPNRAKGIPTNQPKSLRSTKRYSRMERGRPKVTNAWKIRSKRLRSRNNRGAKIFLIFGPPSAQWRPPFALQHHNRDAQYSKLDCP